MFYNHIFISWRFPLLTTSKDSTSVAVVLVKNPPYVYLPVKKGLPLFFPTEIMNPQEKPSEWASRICIKELSLNIPPKNLHLHTVYSLGNTPQSFIFFTFIGPLKKSEHSCELKEVCLSVSDFPYNSTREEITYFRAVQRVIESGHVKFAALFPERVVYPINIENTHNI